MLRSRHGGRTPHTADNVAINVRPNASNGEEIYHVVTAMFTVGNPRYPAGPFNIS